MMFIISKSTNISMTKVDTKLLTDEYEINYRGDDLYILQYSAGVLSEKGAAIKVSKEEFNYVSTNPISLQALIAKFELNKNKVLYRIGAKQQYIDTRDHSDKTKHHRKGYFASSDYDGYYLNYQLSRHGDGTGRFKISEEIYEYIGNNEISLTDLFVKYDLHHLDVPENYIL